MTALASSGEGRERQGAERGRAIASAASGAALLAQLGIARETLGADDARAYFLGRPIGLACEFRAHFGVPCPGCGITRGVALALHGEVAHAWQLFPAAPLAVAGLAALAVSLLGIALLEWAGPPESVTRVERWLLRASLAYASATASVWLVAWAIRLVALATLIGARPPG